MKLTKKINQLFLATIVLGMATTGCHNGKTDTQEEYIQEEFTVTTVADSITVNVYNPDSDNDQQCTMAIEVDFPVNGPQQLTDSIKYFLNKELYNFINAGKAISFDEICAMNTDNIATLYCETYRSEYEKMDFGATEASISIDLIAETDAFVTYEIDKTSCAAGCWYSTNWAVFRKADGKRIKEIITMENLERFLKENPDLDEEHIADQLCVSSFGLLEDGLILFYDPTGWTNQLELEYSYQDILPYLSKEVQDLIATCKECNVKQK